MRKTNASILSLISILGFFTFLPCESYSAQNKDTVIEFISDSTFFPLAVGNYWVWQDSFFTKDTYNNALEMTNNEAATEIRKDSVIKITITNDNYRIILKREIYFKEGRKRPIKYDTGFVDESGKLRVGTNLAMKLNLSSGDTILRNGEIFIAKKCSNENSHCYNVFRADSDITEFAIRFVKGIGRVGQRSQRNASNLIEYRIGNGPVIKKHWLMEAPVKK
jgi:hypothetical protein